MGTGTRLLFAQVSSLWSRSYFMTVQPSLKTYEMKKFGYVGPRPRTTRVSVAAALMDRTVDNHDDCSSVCRRCSVGRLVALV